MTKSASESSPLLVKIGEKWVNLDVWKRVHPGGAQSLERFRGQDATDAFESLHSIDAIKMVEKMKNVESSVPKKMLDEVTKPTQASVSFRKFRAQLLSEGWFERTWSIDFFHVGLITLFAIVGTYISYSSPYLAALLIGLAMQQAGWIGHDYIHGRGKMSFILGIGIGSLFNGFSSRWWSEKHNKHHVHTNQFGVDDDIQNDPILHLWFPEPEKDHPLRPYQHLYYHFVYAFLYYSWRLQSIQFNMQSPQKLEMFLIGLNYLWLLCMPLKVSLLSILIGGFFVAEVVTATHQSEEIIEGLSFNFVDDQFRTTRDVETDIPFMNYFWGGMQYQLEHHLFPTMPKYRYPELRQKLKDWAKTAGVEYRTASVFGIVSLNYETMRKFASTEKSKSTKSC